MREKTKVKTMQKQKAIQAIKKQAKGITLIALVVTIIVLLILAGVAISLTIGQNGIITRAQTAVIINENASVYEQLQLKIADYQMDNIETGKNEVILDRLKADGHVREINGANILNVTSLMGRSMQTGNGSIETGDVYVIEQRQVTASSVTSDTTEDMDYYLIYYGENNSTSTNLGLAFNYDKAREEYKKYITISPEGVISLNSEYSFYGQGTKREEIVSLEIPEYINGIKVREITSDCFNNCFNLEKIILPNGLESIGESAFYGCKKLTQIDIPNSVKSVGSSAFVGCEALEKVSLSDSLEIIGAYAFAECIQLTEITIPSNVQRIDSYAFNDCTSLERIYVPFTQEEGEPVTWNALWNCNCDAEIIYKVEE